MIRCFLGGTNETNWVEPGDMIGAGLVATDAGQIFIWERYAGGWWALRSTNEWHWFAHLCRNTGTNATAQIDGGREPSVEPVSLQLFERPRFRRGPSLKWLRSQILTVKDRPRRIFRDPVMIEELVAKTRIADVPSRGWSNLDDFWAGVYTKSGDLGLVTLIGRDLLFVFGPDLAVGVSGD